MLYSKYSDIETVVDNIDEAVHIISSMFCAYCGRRGFSSFIFLISVRSL